MKIKIKEIIFEEKIIGKEIELDLPLIEIKEMIEYNIAKDLMRDEHIIKSMKKKFFYTTKKATDELIEIEIGDKVRILPAEYCCSDADTLKYSEVAEGLIGFIISINHFENKITMKTASESVFNVHPTWIELVKKKS